MRKLISAVLVALFAFTNVAFAASHAGGKMDAKKDEKKAAKK